MPRKKNQRASEQAAMDKLTLVAKFVGSRGYNWRCECRKDSRCHCLWFKVISPHGNRWATMRELTEKAINHKDYHLAATIQDILSKKGSHVS